MMDQVHDCENVPGMDEVIHVAGSSLPSARASAGGLHDLPPCETPSEAGAAP